jgi:hypothetical protein
MSLRPFALIVLLFLVVGCRHLDKQYAQVIDDFVTRKATKVDAVRELFGAAAEAVSAANAASTAARGRMLARARSSGGRHAGAGHGSEPRRGGSAVHVLAAAACPQARTGALQAPAAVASGKSPTSCALGGGLCRGGAAESGGNDKDTRTAAGRRRRRLAAARHRNAPAKHRDLNVAVRWAAHVDHGAPGQLRRLRRRVVAVASTSAVRTRRPRPPPRPRPSLAQAGAGPPP